MAFAPLRTWALIGLVISSGEAVAAAPRPTPKVEVCALGAQVLAEKARSGWRVFDGRGGGAEALFGGARGNLPKSLRAIAAAHPPRGLFETCPELIDHLPAGARMATQEDLASQTAGSRLWISALSAPLIDRLGHTAAVYEYSSCGAFCAHGGIFVYRREAGRWARTGAVMTMAS
jgi:hypothetical protein